MANPEQFRQIETPPYLTPGQNLYDQLPFNTLIRAISQKYNINQTIFHFSLSILSGKILKKEYANDTNQRIKFIKYKTTLPGLKNSVTIKLKNYKENQLAEDCSNMDSQIYNNAIFELIGSPNGLDQYPYWQEYIHTFTKSDYPSGKIYNGNGEINSQWKNKPLPPILPNGVPTYPQWLLENQAKLEMERPTGDNTIPVVLAETFPQSQSLDQIITPGKPEPVQYHIARRLINEPHHE